MHCKSYSHFFSKKFQHICVSLDVNFNESLTNDVVSFEQLGPDVDAKSDADANRINTTIISSHLVRGDKNLDTVKHLNLAAANFGSFYKWTFRQIYILANFLFQIKKSVMFGIALCVLCKQGLHGDLQDTKFVLQLIQHNNI